jgi:hypothetical protein
MGLSSNTLIHLTLKKEALIGIIKEGFKIKYCYENLKTINGSVTAAFPMVSFSDIPLSELSYHIESYGNYGIGLKKEWAKKNGLNPVLYFDNKSNLGGTIRKDFREFYIKKDKDELDQNFVNTIFEILSYSKNYEGILKTKKITRENYRFSDEREWRYVPNKEILGKAKSYIGKSDYETEEKKKIANDKLKELRLKIEPDDINYVFVEKESEIEEIITILRSSNSTKPHSSVERLLTRIMTTEQIKTDI